MENKKIKLENEIIRLNELYRIGQPEISDIEYDSLVDILKKYFPDSSLLKNGVLSFETTRKSELPCRMASLNKKKSIDELNLWIKNLGIPKDTDIILTPKFDGISLVSIESQNKFWTRGDGFVGQISNEHASRLISNPFVTGFSAITYGEAIMKRKTFQDLYSQKYKSARNLVAGLFNRNEPGDELLDVHYVRYGCINHTLKTKKDQLDFCNEINSFKVPYVKMKIFSLDIETLNELYTKWKEYFEIDGIVIDINDSVLSDKLGREDNGNPKYACAFKNPNWAGVYNTIVKDVVFKVSKQGKLKPVISVEPVNIDGVIVENVTGYNAAYIIDNFIARNSVIEIIRSGDVIPKHLRTIKHYVNELEKLIDHNIICSSCGEPVKWDKTYTELICLNEECPGIKLSKIVHFFQMLEVEEFSEASIKTLFDCGYNSVNSILRITKNDLVKIPGWGDKSSETLLKQFKKLNEIGVPLAKLLHALDVFDGKLGEKTSQLIIDNTNCELHIPEIEDLIKIKGVQTITAEAFLSGYIRFMSEPSLFNIPVKISMIRNIKPENKNDLFSGYKVCFTGVRSSELEKRIVEGGGEIVSGVSKNTTHLVVKDLSEKTLSSNKAVKAKELGIKVIEIKEFENF